VGFTTKSLQPSHPRCEIHVYPDRVTQGLRRYYGTHDLHFITWSCYRRQPLLDTPERRDLLLVILEEARRKYQFVVHGYVVMPEHVHVLMTEAEQGDPAVVMKVIKQRFARQVKQEGQTSAALICDHIWQKRFLRFQRMERTQTH
jgi:REP element-mobilizing transposase RayT